MSLLTQFYNCDGGGGGGLSGNFADLLGNGGAYIAIVNGGPFADINGTGSNQYISYAGGKAVSTVAASGSYYGVASVNTITGDQSVKDKSWVVIYGNWTGGKFHITDSSNLIAQGRISVLIGDTLNWSVLKSIQGSIAIDWENQSAVNLDLKDLSSIDGEIKICQFGGINQVASQLRISLGADTPDVMNKICIGLGASATETFANFNTIQFLEANTSRAALSAEAEAALAYHESYGASITGI